MKNLLKRVAKIILRPLLNRLAAHSNAIDSLKSEFSNLRAAHSNEIDLLKNKVNANKSETFEAIKIITNSLLPVLNANRSDYQSPQVSIIMPTYNRGGFISEAISSVKALAFQNWELIIVDDGSIDETHEIVGCFLNDSRIRYVRQEHLGCAVARNKGLKLSKGQYVAYLDSDNLWYPNFISSAVAFLDSNQEIDLVYAALVTDYHGKDRIILFKEFDKNSLLEGNYIDLNVIVHRRKLYEMYGGFDEALDRLLDWDLILRYTQHKPAQHLFFLGANYREIDKLRISKTAMASPNIVHILRKYPPGNGLKNRPKVLYVLWHYPQLSETYVETEIKKMRQWGCSIEIWRQIKPASPYFSDVVIHDGDLNEVITKIKPDLIHIHWISFARVMESTLDNLNIPVTIRLHGFDTTRESIEYFLKKSYVKAIYGFPHHTLETNQNGNLKKINISFDSQLFKPAKNKNRKLIVRASAGIPSKDIPMFLELAKELPEFKFILALIPCNHREKYIDQFKNLANELKSPVEILVSLSRESIAKLISEAGIYLHTTNAIGSENATPIGMPISIAEAMATGAYIIVRDIDELINYVGDAGAAYHDINNAVEIIRATELWSDEMWEDAWKRSIERAFCYHADEITLRPIFDDWLEIARNNKLSTTLFTFN